MAVLYGQMDILEQAGGRFASIGGTETKAEHWSNLDRLVEAAAVLKHIQESPWIGHGLGFTYLNTNTLTQETSPQWWVDQNYLLIWLKHGLLGLGLFFWLLWVAYRLGAREARKRADPWEASWLATTSGATVCMAVFAMFDWPFAQVYSTLMLGLLWGGSIAMTREGTVRFQWSAPRP
jgi:O-antigen ligase